MMTRDSPPESEARFSCPICLAENQLGGFGGENAVGERPAFVLTSCSHAFCASCLRAYVRSKLMDGVVDIPCCHFKLSAFEEDFHQCNILISEADLRRLIHMDCGELKLDDWCGGKDGHGGVCGMKEADREINWGADQLWTKYQKLKFDLHHGKECVRRCPKCDHAHLFDEERMRQYQAKYLAQNDGVPENGGRSPRDGGIPTSGNATRFERAIGIFRQIRREGPAAAPSGAGGSTDGNGASYAALGEMKCKEGDGQLRPDGDVEPSGVATVGDEEDASGANQQVNTSLSEADVQTSDASQPTPKHLAKSRTPNVTCGSCGTEFCYFHSNAHSGTSCVEYHKKALESDRANIEYASSALRAKACPNCGISVSKEGGCNQIKCGSCGTHFCWICRAVVDDGAFPEHFRWWNLRGCANMQLDENDDPLICTIWGAKLLSVLQIVVLGVPSCALALVTMILCPCFMPGCGRNMRERVINCVSFYGSFMSSLIMLPFTCVGMMLLSALYCLLAAIAFLTKLFSSTRSNNTNNAVTAEGRESNANDSGNAANAAAAEDLIRELESIFERVEEGLSTTNSS